MDSGTYDYFTLAIVGKEHYSRGDFTASEDDNILVHGVAGDTNALGFFGLAYYAENEGRLKAAPIKLDDFAPGVLPSVENAKNGIYQPLSRPIFIYVNKRTADAKENVWKFVEFYLNVRNAVTLVTEVGYVPLPEEGIRAFQRRFANRDIGSAFLDGSQTGISIEELVRMPLRSNRLKID